MENNNSKFIALVALVVAVVGLGIGFAAFSSTLTISSSATVTPNASTFKVVYNPTGASAVTCTPSGGATVTSSGSATETTITGIKIGFTQPGQSATCTATIKNTGEYIAYLNSITFGKLSCTKTDETATDTLVQSACDSISAKLTVGTTSVTSTKATAGTNSNISSHSLAAKTGTEEVSLLIKYDGPGRADGAFSVTIPTATLVYSSVD